MLTDSEREWLRLRPHDGTAYCWHCQNVGRDMKGCLDEPYCALVPDYKDAAEFSERVAARMAELFAASTEIAPLCASCPCEDDCYANRRLKCGGQILKYARLQVEEEMECSNTTL